MEFSDMWLVLPAKWRGAFSLLIVPHRWQ